MNEICVNKLVSDTESGAQYLVLWVSSGNEYGYWYNLNGKFRIPDKFFLKDVSSAKYNRYEISDWVNTDLIRSENALTPIERQRREQTWKKIKEAVEYEPEIYESETRITILRMIAEENGIKPNGLYELLDKYWRFGKSKNAFIPNFSNCGGKGKVRSKRRITDKTDKYSKTLTDQDRINFETAVKRYYLNRNKMSFKSVYEKLLQDFYAVKLNESESEKLLKLLPPSERPSLRQFRYWYSRHKGG